jgi:hypothetical protein
MVKHVILVANIRKVFEINKLYAAFFVTFA